jgi:branched-chain amino acid transport system ATP-binding protein
MISVQKLDKHFGGVYAVHNCTFTVKDNTITSIIGPNGAGKTTLFNLVCGIMKPDGGRVLLKGKDITGMPTHTIARLGVCRTFQQARLFKNMSVRDNLLIAKPNARESEMKEVLKKVHFPLDMGVRGSDLSYGQTRLVEIARALL